MRPASVIVVSLGACAVAAIGAFSSAKSDPTKQLPEIPVARAADADPHAPYGVGKAPFEHRAATSCAAASCHGGGQVGKVGSEHSTWAPEAFPKDGASDPHTKAYRVLFNSVSTEMVAKLAKADPERWKNPPHKEKACLVCHAVDSASAKDPDTRDQILSEGVGCGACHGPADKWIGQHYTSDWAALTPREKWEKYGFVPTKNLVARTLNCASCHIGGGERDMNHDFIAAGHPRLAFEAARFHAQPDYRKHWQEKLSNRDFEVRMWVIGQAAALRTSVNLLYERAARAEAGDKNTPWPEFSGYSCYACHQKIPSTEVRGALSESKRKPGVPGWDVWSNAAVDVAAKSCELAFPGLSSSGLTDVKLPALEKLRELMGQKLALSPKEVKEHAATARDELDRWLVALQRAEDVVKQNVAPDSPRAIAHKLAVNALSADGSKLADHDWDALAANYLGTASMFSASGKDAAKWEEPLLTLRKNLRFPPVTDGGGGVFNSPFDRDRKKLLTIRENFETLRTKTSTPEGK